MCWFARLTAVGLRQLVCHLETPHVAVAIVTVSAAHVFGMVVPMRATTTISGLASSTAPTKK